MNIEFKYDIGEDVIVRAVNARGYVDALMFGISGMEYRCVYWMDGCRRQEWLTERELLNAGD